MIIDILFLLLIFFIGIFGARKGFLDEISEFVGIGLATWITLSFYVDLTVKLYSLINFPEKLTQFIAALIIFVFIVLIIRFMASVLSFLFQDSSIFSFGNQLLGFLFGVLKGTLLLILFLWFFDSYISSAIYNMVETESKIISFINPIKDCINQSITIPL